MLEAACRAGCLPQACSRTAVSRPHAHLSFPSCTVSSAPNSDPASRRLCRPTSWPVAHRAPLSPASSVSSSAFGIPKPLEAPRGFEGLFQGQQSQLGEGIYLAGSGGAVGAVGSPAVAVAACQQAEAAVEGFLPSRTAPEAEGRKGAVLAPRRAQTRSRGRSPRQRGTRAWQC